MSYYCYIYNDEKWVAYYVGKGQKNRKDRRRAGIPVPPDEQKQVFEFENEWEAWECEIELIAFYGRKCDGGTLLNKSTGGPGSTGNSHSGETRTKISKAHTGRTFSEESRAKMSRAHTGMMGAACPSSRHWLVTCPDGQILSLHGLNQFCREKGLNRGHLSAVANGKRSHHKGYTVEKIEGENAR